MARIHHNDNEQQLESVLEDMEIWSHDLDLGDTPRGWFSNNWVLSSPAMHHTQVGSHHISWQSPLVTKPGQTASPKDKG